MRLAIDLDDVVLDFAGGVMEAFRREFGEDYPYDGDPWGPQMVAFTKHPKLIAAGYDSWWDWLSDGRDRLWSHFPAIPGSIGGLTTLRHRGHYLECVTTKPEWAEAQVWKWLGKWRPPFHRVTIVSMGQLKSDYTKADCIIDDKLATCQEFADIGREAIRFQRKRDDADPHRTIITARDWSQVITAVSRMEKGLVHE